MQRVTALLMPGRGVTFALADMFSISPQWVRNVTCHSRTYSSKGSESSSPSTPDPKTSKDGTKRVKTPIGMSDVYMALYYK
jgi:hypothetical protein